MTSNDDNKWPLVGNRHITEFLAKSYQKGIASGAFVFAGPEDLGKTTAARYFAQLLLCREAKSAAEPAPCGRCGSCRRMIGAKDASPESRGLTFETAHSDFVFIEKEPGKKNISIEQVRGFIGRMEKGSFLGAYKIGIIKDADHLSVEAANALLKTLEEPKKQVVIILTVRSADNLPATILSRAQLLSFGLVSADILYDRLVSHYGSARPAAKVISRLSMGRPALAAKLFEDKEALDSRLKAARVFLSCLDAPLYERFSLAWSAADEARAADTVPGLLEVWHAGARDLALAAMGHFDLVANQESLKEIRQSARSAGLGRISRLHEVFERSKKYLEANVNPKTVLDYVVLEM